MSPLDEKYAREGLEICEYRAFRAMDQVLHMLDQCELLPQRTEQESDLRNSMEVGLLRVYAALGRMHFAAERGKPVIP